MSDIKVIDNFLEREVCENIKSLVQAGDFPWYKGPVIGKYNDGLEFTLLCDEIDNYQFSHILYEKYEPKSNYFNILVPFINKLDISALYNAKINYNPKTETQIEHSFHIDTSSSCTTSIYYLNTNNGYTLFEDGTKVKSVENRMVLFPSNLYHTGTTCTDKQGRIILNINYF